MKAMLVTVSVAFYRPVIAQNIMANPDFNDIVKCCEVRQPHFAGWLEIKNFYSIQRRKKSTYMGVSQGTFFIGSLIKPIHKGQYYTLRIKLDRKESFYLKYACFQRVIFINTMDTVPLNGLVFQRVLVKNERYITIQISPEDSFCNYIAFEIEPENAQLMGAVYFDSIRLTDPTEDSKAILNRYYNRITEIYAEKRRHRFSKPCEEKTLSD